LCEAIGLRAPGSAPRHVAIDAESGPLSGASQGNMRFRAE